MLNIYALEQQILGQLQTASVPGCALALVQDEEIVYARGFGVTSSEDGAVAVTPHTLFRLGSTTKPLTGTVVMRLVESGALDLDCPVTTYLPWFSLGSPELTERITLRRLLSMTAGLPKDFQFVGRRDHGALEAHVREDIAHYALFAPPARSISTAIPASIWRATSRRS
jgi:CubicO group peptidase (beta-lactamase class C family)